MSRKRQTISGALRKQVLLRDLDLCQACGFDGKEVHHIIPVYKNPLKEFDITNLITLCGFCHKHAPDKPEEFAEYLNEGGATTKMLWGNFFVICEKKGLDIHKHLPTMRNILKILKNTSANFGLEKYQDKLKELPEIPDFKIEENVSIQKNPIR